MTLYTRRNLSLGSVATACLLPGKVRLRRKLGKKGQGVFDVIYVQLCKNLPRRTLIVGASPLTLNFHRTVVL